MTALRPPYKTLLRDDLDATARDRMWHRIEARRRRGKTAGREWRGVAVGLVAGVAAVMALAQLPAKGQPHVLSAAVAPSLAQTRSLAVASSATVRHEAKIGPRTVDAGMATLTFDDASVLVEHAPHHLTIRVERGEVVVHSAHLAGGVAHLSAGMLLEIDELAEAAPAPEGSSWRALAARGANPQAYAALGAGGIGAASSRASVDDLLALADVARLSGHPREALDPLGRVLRDHATDGRAPLAALTLGRVYLDEIDEPANAAVALSRAIELGVPRALEEDAYARLVEAQSRAGDAAAARTTFERAVAKFPNGSREPSMRKWLDPR